MESNVSSGLFIMGWRWFFRYINYRYYVECNRLFCWKCGYLFFVIWYSNVLGGFEFLLDECFINVG